MSSDHRYVIPVITCHIMFVPEVLVPPISALNMKSTPGYNSMAILVPKNGSNQRTEA